MVTEVGKFLRLLRSSCGEYLMDMAQNLSMSQAMLSCIETGKRNIPDDFESRLTVAYSLSDEQRIELNRAIAETRGGVFIGFDSLSRAGREFACSLAMAFPNLNEDEILRLKECLETVDFEVRESKAPSISSERVVPERSVFVNPDDCNLEFLYMIWFTNPEAPCDQIQAWKGDSVGPIFLFYSSRGDLYKYGKAKPVFDTKEDQIACHAEMSKLNRAMAKVTRDVFSCAENLPFLQYLWINIDEVFDATWHIGASAIVEKPKSRG